MNFLRWIILLPVAFAAAPTESQLKKEWTGEWHRASLTDSASVSITNVTGAGFHFSFSATSGMNVGELTGDAKLETNGRMAQGKVSDCQVNFSFPAKEGFDSKVPISKLDVTTSGKCEEWGGNGVSFDGDFTPEGRPLTYATSYDCQAANNHIEKAICADELLAEADRELSRLYHSKLSDDPSRAKDIELKKSQLAWIKLRNQACGKATPPSSCLVTSYAKRIIALRSLDRTAKGLDFRDFANSDLDRARDLLWNDVLTRLILRENLHASVYEELRSHNIYVAETKPKPMTEVNEISILATVRGDNQTAGISLTRDNQLWAMVVGEENGKRKPVVYGPKDETAQPPPAVKDWIRQFGKGPVSPIQRVFP